MPQKFDFLESFVKPNDVVVTLGGHILNVAESFGTEDIVDIIHNRLAIIPSEELQDPALFQKVMPDLREEVSSRLNTFTPSSEGSESKKAASEKLVSALRQFESRLSDENLAGELYKDAIAASRRCKVTTTPYHQQQVEKAFDKYPELLTEDMKVLFQSSPLCVGTISDLRKINKAIPKQVNYHADNTAHIVLFDPRMAQEVLSGDIDSYCAMLYDLAMRSAKLQSHVVPEDKALLSEYHNSSLAKQYYGKSITLNAERRQICGSMHRWLHDGKHTEAQVRRDFPLCMKLYDEINAAMHEEAQTRQAYMPINQEAGNGGEPVTPVNTSSPPAAQDIDRLVQEANPSKHFIISDSCSAEQKIIFQNINRALDILGMTPDALDRRFRAEMMLRVETVVESAKHGFAKQITPEQVRAWTTPSAEVGIAQTIEIRERDERKLLEVLTPAGMVQVTLKTPLTNEFQAKRVMTGVERIAPDIRKMVTDGLKNLFGDFYAMDPALLTTPERQVYNTFIDRNPNAKQATRASGTASNILQQLAAGKSIFSKEGTYASWDDVPGVHIETPSLDVYGVTSILAAIKSVAREKGIANQSEKNNAINDILGSISENYDKLIIANQKRLKEVAAEAGAKSVIPDTSVPYYILDESKQTSPVPLPPAFLKTGIPPFNSGRFFLTPACIHRAQMTGEYRLATFSEAINEQNDLADSSASIRNVLGSFGVAAETTESFRETLRRDRDLLELGDVSCTLSDGRLLDMARYYAEAEKDADKWTAALNRQVNEYATQLTSTHARADVVRQQQQAGLTKRFNQMYQDQLAVCGKS